MPISSVRLSTFRTQPEPLQAAIYTGAQEIVIDCDVEIGPTRLRDNLVLRAEGDYTVMARAGAFPNNTDCLLRGEMCSNVCIWGGTYCMRRSEYTGGEHRHCIGLYGCSDVDLDTSVADAGGDGLYVGSQVYTGWRYPCMDITAKVAADNCFRQGMSVTGARRVMLHDCCITRTHGTAPQAAIDIEPNWMDEIQDITVRDCTMIANEGSGLLVNLARFNVTSPKCDIEVYNNYISGSRQPGLRIISPDGDMPETTIDVDETTITDIQYAGLYCKWHLGAPMKLSVTDMLINNVARQPGECPLYLDAVGPKDGQARMMFDDVRILDNQLPLRLVMADESRPTPHISGIIRSPYLAASDAVPMLEFVQ